MPSLPHLKNTPRRRTITPIGSPGSSRNFRNRRCLDLRQCCPTWATALRISGSDNFSSCATKNSETHMAKKKPDDGPMPSPLTGAAAAMLRAPAEVLYAEEIEHLVQEDKHD